MAWNHPKYNPTISARLNVNFFIDKPLQIDTANASMDNATPMINTLNKLIWSILSTILWYVLFQTSIPIKCRLPHSPCSGYCRKQRIQRNKKRPICSVKYYRQVSLFKIWFPQNPVIWSKINTITKPDNLVLSMLTPLHKKCANYSLIFFLL